MSSVDASSILKVIKHLCLGFVRAVSRGLDFDSE
jgi:hypothetical protein